MRWSSYPSNPGPQTPIDSVNAINTDIRRTFRRFRLLARMQAQRATAPMNAIGAGAS